MEIDLLELVQHNENLANQISTLKEDKWFELDGNKYWKDTKKLVKTEIYPEPLIAHSLSALAEYCNENDEVKENKGKMFLHIQSHQSIILYQVADYEGSRPVLMNCQIDNHLESFNFGRWHEPENFTISLMSQFYPSKDLDGCIEKTQTISINKKTIIQDNNGANQKANTTEIQTGIESYIFNLAPFRTFREVEQPTSTFIFRINSDLHCSLNESDGGTWRIEAVRNIKEWLKKHISDIVIIG